MSGHIVEADAVDHRQAQWTIECPDIDTRSMAILGRMRAILFGARPVIEAVSACRGLDSGEFDVLATLLRSGPPYRLRPTELYRSLMVSSGGMTDRLPRLTKRGHVTRTSSPGDGRSLLVELTELGRRVTELTFREDMAVEADLLSVLNEQEQNQLASLLRKLMHVVGA